MNGVLLAKMDQVFSLENQNYLLGRFALIQILVNKCDFKR